MGGQGNSRWVQLCKVLFKNSLIYSSIFSAILCLHKQNVTFSTVWNLKHRYISWLLYWLHYWIHIIKLFSNNRRYSNLRGAKSCLWSVFADHRERKTGFQYHYLCEVFHCQICEVGLFSFDKKHETLFTNVLLFQKSLLKAISLLPPSS